MGLVDDIDRDGDELVRGLIAGARKMTPESEMNSGSSTSQKPFSIVIVNPNSNESMTKGLEDAVSYIKDDKTNFSFVTATSSAPHSINNLQDADDSIKPAMEAVEAAQATDADAYLVACFSPHPLVNELKRHRTVPVIGIMAASIQAALAHCGYDSLPGRHEDFPSHRFGIITTGSQWISIFDEEVANSLPRRDLIRYAGTKAVGVNAGDLHAPGHGDSVKEKVKAATKEFLSKEMQPKVQVIILGCAGMAGMKEWVHEAANEVERGGVRIIDGVVVGAAMLQGYVRTVI